jgi:hypothetical protein
LGAATADIIRFIIKQITTTKTRMVFFNTRAPSWYNSLVIVMLEKLCIFEYDKLFSSGSAY